MLSYFYYKTAVTPHYSEIPAPATGWEDFSDTKGLPMNQWQKKKGVRNNDHMRLLRIQWYLSLAAIITASADIVVFKPTLQSTLKMYMNIFIMTILHMGTYSHREVK